MSSKLVGKNAVVSIGGRRVRALDNADIFLEVAESRTEKIRRRLARACTRAIHADKKTLLAIRQNPRDWARQRLLRILAHAEKLGWVEKPTIRVALTVWLDEEP